MIPKLAKGGSDTSGLLFYLYGPGKRDEHEDPRMVGAWAPWVPDPARSAGTTVGELALLLDAPVHASRGNVPAEHVYHVAVRLAPEDPLLTDEQWAEVARAMMSAVGVAPQGDRWGCRWVAVRHADDHIHIVATKVRQDGTQPNLRQDIVRMQQLARQFEERWELRRLTSGDRTAKRWPTTGETRKASRRHLPESAREQLERTVRTAAAAAASEDDFFARLRSSGLRVAQRCGPGRSAPTGYTVALPGDRDQADRAVWFAGSSLAYDLSLPRVRERWHVPIPEPDVPPHAFWQTLERNLSAASGSLGTGGRWAGAGDVAALGDLLVVAPAAAPPLVEPNLRVSAAEFERAARAPGRRDLGGEARMLLRSSARILVSSARSSGHNDAAAFLGFLLALVAAVTAARLWHEEQGYHLQADAAGKAGRSLRETVEVSTGACAGAGVRPRARRAGSASPRAGRPSLLTEVVARALPAHASAVLVDSAWPVLRERLIALEQRGFDPAAVLAAVVARRELRSAGSVAQVLVWRLDGWAGAHGAALGTRTPAAAPRSTGTPPGVKRTVAPSAEATRFPRNDSQGPRRDH
ncbi:relaxase/mobilization nuclease domain-containing protein [Kitasatospora sp. SUK 42]|uniref:relaxase/mobilization nuclease domain-containing protein n=1 Tax=Kitasatospora sp. SUK 42 TaxID=1588882 RepID=UPI0018CB0BF9|nr:mobilization protein [Kitasatospora sp. SUK 42]MBV2155092.1 relaxase/mobilization nuclease domain-containing protein [Kitasatospora sp. SUK 42]